MNKESRCCEQERSALLHVRVPTAPQANSLCYLVVEKRREIVLFPHHFLPSFQLSFSSTTPQAYLLMTWGVFRTVDEERLFFLKMSHLATFLAILLKY